MPHRLHDHHRRSIRLKGYDYAQPGVYLVTVCTHGRQPLFGEMRHGEVVLNKAGRQTESCRLAIPDHYPRVILDAYVVMPDHLHGLFAIMCEEGRSGGVGADDLHWLRQCAPLQAPHMPFAPPGAQVTDACADFVSPSRTVGAIVRGFKIGVTKWMRANTGVYDVWQRNYHERIVRDERELAAIRHYIDENPRTFAQSEHQL